MFWLLSLIESVKCLSKLSRSTLCTPYIKKSTICFALSALQLIASGLPVEEISLIMLLCSAPCIAYENCHKKIFDVLVAVIPRNTICFISCLMYLYFCCGNLKQALMPWHFFVYTFQGLLFSHLYVPQYSIPNPKELINIQEDDLQHIAPPSRPLCFTSFSPISSVTF